jgi:hypothetical protein
MAYCYDEGDWEFGFRRSLTCGDAEQLQALLDASAHDELEWVLDKSKSFTTKSMYTFMTHRGVVIANSQSIWNTKLPLKIKIFLCQLSNNKLQAAVSLKTQDWKGAPHYCLCGKVENVNHILFGCSMAQFLWVCIRSIFGWANSPTSWNDLQGGSSFDNMNTAYRLQPSVFTGLSWALWNSRNKMAIEKKFPTNPLDIIRYGANFVQRWSPKLKESDHEIVAKMVDKVQV